MLSDDSKGMKKCIIFPLQDTLCLTLTRKRKKMKKVAFYTLGCKVNQYETNAMIQQFIEKGYEVVDFR